MRLDPPGILQEPVSLLTGITPVVGVYFLCKGDVIQFIGSSTNIRDTLYHTKVPQEAWDRVYYIIAPHRMTRSRLKRTMIRKYDPPLNHFTQKEMT